MTYRGRVQNGVVVFEGQAPPEGMLVAVAPAPTPSEGPRPGTPQAILRHAGTWAGTSEELDRILAELKQSKWAE
jgi:hypothetical protein